MSCAAGAAARLGPLCDAGAPGGAQDRDQPRETSLTIPIEIVEASRRIHAPGGEGPGAANIMYAVTRERIR